jgi:GNAT superfamily N-acetyltransferase
VRLATFEDAAMIAEFLGEFFHLSRWAECLEYHQHKAQIYLARALANNFVVYLIALDQDKMVGVCSYHVFDVFTNPMAVMDETYVIKRLQRTDLGRRLITTILALAKADGCAVINFPICSGMPEQNSLMNMVGKHFGADPVGMIFRKVL